MKYTLFVIVLLGLVIGLFQANSFKETIAWLVLGGCGMLGIVTLGQPIKSLLKKPKS
ncbi:hypothetical protein [Guptibacillus spartinae]|uniref:hypothetical protein n=1 Tax=Guptibacillus spartinae TaxID=3025679 RepID=UPI0023611908|nr:hypothetical protein [Pseudalkalibacillus spartinae]